MHERLFEGSLRPLITVELSESSPIGPGRALWLALLAAVLPFLVIALGVLVMGVVGGVVAALHSSRAPGWFLLLLQSTGLVLIAAGYFITIRHVVGQVRGRARDWLSEGSACGIAWLPSTRKAAIEGLGAGLLLAAVIHLLTFLVPYSPPEVWPGLGRLSAEFVLIATGLWIFLAVAVAPFFEEFVFRGMLFAAWARRWGVLAAALGTSGLFVAIHGAHIAGWWPAVFGIAGIALGGVALRLRHRSLLPAIALHAIYNLAVTGSPFLAVN